MILFRPSEECIYEKEGYPGSRYCIANGTQYTIVVIIVPEIIRIFTKLCAVSIHSTIKQILLMFNRLNQHVQDFENSKWKKKN